MFRERSTPGSPLQGRAEFASGAGWKASGLLDAALIAAASFILHFIFNHRYGYFRDEFDYIICGRHLAWGYVDQPPLVPFLSRVCLALFGDSVRSVRVLPDLAISATILLTGLLARELGARRFAVAFSALLVCLAPIYLSGASLLTTNCLEPLLWMGCVYFAILAVKRNPRYWVCFGIVAGIGMEEKYSISVLGFGVVVGLLLTGQRRHLLSRWMWLGGLAALLLFLPNLIWNVENHWPFVELIRNIKADGRDVILSPWEYFSQQALLILPSSALFWITGVIALLVAQRFRAIQFLGIAYLVAFTVFAALHGKNYYLAPIYPVYLAAGCIMIESGIDRIRQWWLKPVILTLSLAGGAVFAPLTVPILPIDQFIPYMNWLPIKVPRSEHSHERIALPQHYADQFGWDEIVQEVAVAYNQLAPAERKDCAIFAQDYGQAGAIDFLGHNYGLPPSISGHQTWWLWGPRGYSGECMIVLDDSRPRLEQLYGQVDFVGTSAANPYALEQQLPVYICRRPKFGTLAQLWPQVKKWR